MTAASDTVHVGGSATITLRAGDIAAPEGSPATITLERVSDDSRCPADATCVWAGDAAIVLRVRPRRGDAASVVLHLNSPEARSADAAGLHLRLESLEPQPRAGYSISAPEYRVHVSVNW